MATNLSKKITTNKRPVKGSYNPAMSPTVKGPTFPTPEDILDDFTIEQIHVGTISEAVSGEGVTIEGVLLEDSTVVTGAGTVSAPSITFASDTDTGIYEPAVNTVGITTGGTERVTVNATGAQVTGTIRVTSSSATSLVVGRQGVTTPAFTVDSSTASQVAGLKVTGAATGGTVAIVATDSGAAANVTLDAKGTGTLTLQGTATGNIIVGDDIVPDVDNTLDIGNLISNNRDIHASRAFINKGVASTEGYGQLALKYKTASKAVAGGATEVIPVQVPSGAILVGALLRNDTVIVGAGAATYSAAYSTGATQAISTGTAFTKNTKVSTFFNVQGAGEATNITSGLTDITLTPNAGTLDTGTVTAVVYYYELTALTDAA